MYAHMYTCTYMYVTLCPDDSTTAVEATAVAVTATAPPSYHLLRIEHLVCAPADVSAFCASFTCSASSAFLEALSYQQVALLRMVVLACCFILIATCKTLVKIHGLCHLDR